MTVPQLKIEKHRRLKDSAVLARSRFLALIPDHRTHVVLDLFDCVFPEYLFAVAEHFRARLIDVDRGSDTSAFLCLSTEIIQGLEDRFQPSWLTKEQPTRNLIDSRRPELVIDHLRGKLSEPLLIELANRPLMKVISKVTQVSEPEIAKAFRDWPAVKNLTCCPGVINALAEWSEHWNLNANWCRDHALRVLRQWLFDDSLRWTFVYGKANALDIMRRKSRLISHWLAAATSNEFAVAWSQAGLSIEIFAGDPNEFSFKRKPQFKAPGFNPVLQDASAWKRKVELDFRIYLYKSEHSRLEQIKTKQNEKADLENRFNGALDAFKKEMLQHVEKLTRKMKKAEKKGLLKVKEKRQQDKHFKWAVRYQIPQSHSQDFELECEIAKEAGVTESAVSKVVTRTLREIDLAIRAKTSKGSADAARRVLSQPGR